jgi:hypothetical protein
MKHRENTQATVILNHLQNHGRITSIECIELYGCTRASSVIMNLRKDHIIETEMKKGENRHGNPCRYGVYIYRGRIAE